jgi:transcriptional regulator with XRE-family HTH domain
MSESDQSLAQLGGAIQQFRARACLTQRELAARAGIDRAFLSGIECGKRNPTVAVVARLARALDTTAGMLLAGVR